MNPRMMTCDEFKELAPAYALIALDEDERRACAQHLAALSAHRGCTEAVEQAALVAARLGTALAPALPPPRVWQNIAAEVRAQASRAQAITGPLSTTASAASIEEERRRGIYQICGWLLAITLLGLCLYGLPFDFRRRQPATLGTSAEAESPVQGGGSSAAQHLTASRH